jgi:hypothetical protein
VVACALAATEAGCGPQWTDPGSLLTRPPGSPFTRLCYIPEGTIPNPYDPTGHYVNNLTNAECEQKKEEARAAAEEANRARAAEAQRAAQLAQADQQRRAAAVAQIVRDEWARGYRHITVKDLYIDGKAYADSHTKVSVSGFYRALSRHYERLYNSGDEYMAHTLNPSAYGSAEALNVGLLTDTASRSLRAALLSCEGGCVVTILGHVAHCVETNAFGRAAQDICLVAEDISATSY